jgi:hypothetical protein
MSSGNTSGKPPPFAKGCEGFARLRELIENGTIGAETAPKTAYSLDPLFGQYNLSAFRAGLNKIKSEMGLMLRSTNEQPGE